MDSSPTLVVKSVKRINSAFFPWSSRVIVPACCFSYEVVKEEKKEGYEEHVKEVDDESGEFLFHPFLQHSVSHNVCRYFKFHK